MENFLDKLKKKFGLNDTAPADSKEGDDPVPALQENPPVAPMPPKTVSSLPPAPQFRDAVIGFIIHTLQPYIDEKSVTVSGLVLYVLCTDKETETLAATALMLHRADAFRKEYLEYKLLNNFIALASNWSFECQLIKEEMPANCCRQGNFGLDIIIGTRQRAGKQVIASLKAITGQTEYASYELNSQKQQKYNIGRGKQPQLASGRLHTNDIVFLNREDTAFDEQQAAGNLSVSRNHACISYNPETNSFFLYAGTGGMLASNNKIKLYKTNDSIERINIAGVGHELNDGDVIELGGEARLLFTVAGA